MFQNMKTSTLNWIIIIGIVLLTVQIMFFDAGLIFFGLLTGFTAYFGYKRYHKDSGKLMFWLGAIGVLFTLLNMTAVRFLVIIGIVLFVKHYYDGKQKTKEWDLPDESEREQEPMLELKPLMSRRFFEDQVTSESGYEWRDVSIHGGFGDRVLDLSNTVLPQESVISIRHMMGNVIVYIPYEVEVEIHHSSLFGRAHILGKHQMNLMNHTLSYRTHQYRDRSPRVRLITSILSGDLEVKRI